VLKNSRWRAEGDVQPPACGDDDVDAVLSHVPEPLEVSLPAGEAVDLVEGRERLRRPLLRLRSIGVDEAIGVAADGAPPPQVVPVAIEIGRASLVQQSAGECRLAHLPGADDEGHAARGEVRPRLQGFERALHPTLIGQPGCWSRPSTR